MSSAISLNLDQSRILSSGNGLNHRGMSHTQCNYLPMSTYLCSLCISENHSVSWCCHDDVDNDDDDDDNEEDNDVAVVIDDHVVVVEHHDDDDDDEDDDDVDQDEEE